MAQLPLSRAGMNQKSGNQDLPVCKVAELESSEYEVQHMISVMAHSSRRSSK